MTRKTLTERFWQKVIKGHNSECWEWSASMHDTGYGQIYLEEVDGKSHKEFAHRVAWQLTNGKIPFGKHVLHHCDNRKCCNPAHLFLGSNNDNVNDMVLKKRHTFGENHPFAKLTEAQAIVIKGSGGTPQSIGAIFGISAASVYDIKQKRTWKHLL